MPHNNPIWVMSSAFPRHSLEQVLAYTKQIGAQGVEVCVFRRDGTRNDHIATHIDYEDFGPTEAQQLLDKFNRAGLKLSIAAYDNLIGGSARSENQNHLLRLIRIAALLGGDRNDVKVGTFVGYNHELAVQDGGFEKNLEEYQRVFTPIIGYAESLGVTVLYENCPMEGWRPAASPMTYNNLPATLAARKLMYTLIPSNAHGETYDPSHDIWQNIDPTTVIRNSDMARIKRVHVKGSRLKNSVATAQWGKLYPQQEVSAQLAARAQVTTAQNEWDRHHYEPTLPGFGGSDSIDWRAFIECLNERGFTGPYVIENEATLSKGTGNTGAIVQGFQAALLAVVPLVWPLQDEIGYAYVPKHKQDLVPAPSHDLPVLTMDQF